MRLLRLLLGRKFSYFATLALSSIRPPKSRKHDVTGYCTVCCKSLKFFFNPWTISKKTLMAWGDPSFCEKMLIRESMFCRKCGTNSRARSLFHVLLSEERSKTLNQLEIKNLAAEKHYSILSINQIGNSQKLTDLLTEKFWLTLTTYNPNASFGTMIQDRRNENVLELTFEKDTFDFVLHSDVLEHIPNWEVALSECYRVLKPNGKLIFTAPIHDYLKEIKPYYPQEANQIDPAGKKIYHGQAGGIFSLIPVQADFLEMYQFGQNFKTELRRKFAKVEKMEFKLGKSDLSTEVFIITKSDYSK